MNAIFEMILRWVLAGIVVGLPAYGVLFGSLGAMDKFEAMIWCTPVVAVLAVLTKHHLRLLLFCSAFAVSIPLVGYRPIPMPVLALFLIFAGYVARLAIVKTSSVRGVDRYIDTVMFITSIAVVSWIAIARPSMASFGSEIGGAWETMMALAGIVGYWGTRSLRNQSHNWRNLALVTLFGSIAGLIWKVVSIKLDDGTPAKIIIGCFFASGWWFYSIALGIAVKIWRSQNWRFSVWPVYLIAVLLIMHSFMSGYRSRILFAPLMIGAAFWCGKLRKSMLLFILAFLCLAVFLANSDIGLKLPGEARRVLSPIRMNSNVSDTWTAGELELGEFGAGSPWRMAVWQNAWSKIRERPLVGNGFAFSGADLYADMVYASSSNEAITRGVETSGQFHSVPINLMYYLGIPVALLFCLAWLLVFKRLISLATESQGWLGAFVIGLLGYLIAATGQALTTGGGIDFMAVCMVMGIYQAIAPSVSESPSVSPESDMA
jgi:hypothetical protein